MAAETAQTKPDLEPPTRNSWRAVDLTQVLSGEYKPLKPEVGSRTDGVHLLYAGKTHTLSSEPEAGKSWLALRLGEQVMRQGHNVVYIDCEDDPGGIVGRLRAMQVEVEMIQEKFNYIHPEASLHNPEEFHRYVWELDPHLVVIDGVTEAMSEEGLNMNDNQAVADFFNLLPKPLAKQGAAVLLLDHEVKRASERGRYGIGAQHKLAAVSGAALKLRPRSPFGVGLTGESELVVVKDRPGQLRKHADGDGVLGALRVKSLGSDLVDVTISPEFQQIKRVNQREKLMEEVSATMVTEFPDGMNTKGEIKEKMHKNGQLVGKALNELIDRGHVSSSKPYKIIRPYQAGDDER